MDQVSASTKKTITLSIKLLFGALFIGGIYLLLRGEQPWAPFKRVQVPWLLASVGLSLLMVGVSCYKWRLLLGLQGHHLPFLAMLRIYFIGYMFSTLPTSNLGGDVVRSFYAGDRIGDHGDAAVSVFLERFTGLLLLLVLAVLGPLVQPALYRELTVVIPVAAASVLLGLIVLLIFTDRPLDWAERLGEASIGRVPLLGPLFDKIMAKVRGFHGKLRSAMKALIRRPLLLLPVMGLTVLFYAATWLNIYISYKAFAVEPAWTVIIAVTAVAMLAGVLPLGGFGLIELSMIYYFTLAGFESEDSFAMSMLLRFKVMFLGLIGLVFYLSGSERKKPMPGPET